MYFYFLFVGISSWIAFAVKGEMPEAVFAAAAVLAFAIVTRGGER